ARLLILPVGLIRLREATGREHPRHEFCLHPCQRVSSCTRAASSGTRATVRRARRARQRMRGAEVRKIEITQTPERRIHVSETANQKTGLRSQKSEVRAPADYADS